MLETYFFAPKTLNRLRTGPSAPYIDGFAAGLEETGYSPASAVRYLRAAGLTSIGPYRHWRIGVWRLYLSASPQNKSSD